MGCIRDDGEDQYRSLLVRDFVSWSQINHLQLNTLKTKELVIDFRKSSPQPRPVTIRDNEVEIVANYKYLGLWLDSKLDWTCCIDHLYSKGQSRLYFLRRLGSCNIWGGNLSKGTVNGLEKLIRQAGSVVGMWLDLLVTVAKKRTL